MEKNDNAHSLRMVENIKKVVGEAEAKAFEEAFPLSKSADIEKKFKWAKAGCEYLEQKF